MFLDEAIIWVRSGAGGNGCVSFRREKYVPRGGPDGGNGGRGGSVYLRGTRHRATLLDIGRRKHYMAESGRQGSGSDRHGRSGKDLHLDLPLGTVVREVVDGVDPRQGPILGELLEEGKWLRVARGGRGGKGNRAFATATNQTPRTAEEGSPSEERQLYLELKLLADVGLVGLPNAGKSTLLSRISKATPKVADYPFTTLKPHLGIAELEGYRRLVVADIPGLIEGAHEGHGLGTEFLRHIERTRVLLHLLSAEEKDVGKLLESYRIVEAELACHSEVLAGKKRLVVLTKTDLLGADEQRRTVDELSGTLGAPVAAISAVVGSGLNELLRAAAALVDRATAGAEGPKTSP